MAADVITQTHSLPAASARGRRTSAPSRLRAVWGTLGVEIHRHRQQEGVGLRDLLRRQRVEDGEAFGPQLFEMVHFVLVLSAQSYFAVDVITVLANDAQTPALVAGLGRNSAR